jgi:hypothetical protein
LLSACVKTLAAERFHRILYFSAKAEESTEGVQIDVSLTDSAKVGPKADIGNSAVLPNQQRKYSIDLTRFY